MEATWYEAALGLNRLSVQDIWTFLIAADFRDYKRRNLSGMKWRFSTKMKTRAKIGIDHMIWRYSRFKQVICTRHLNIYYIQENIGIGYGTILGGNTRFSTPPSLAQCGLATYRVTPFFWCLVLGTLESVTPWLRVDFCATLDNKNLFLLLSEK